MYGLTATLSLASQALSAESGAIAITNNNIANVNTPGYSRQIATLSPDVLMNDTGTPGNGVVLQGATSVRDEILNLSLQQKTSDVSSLSAQAALWSQIEGHFADSSNGIGGALSSVFSSLSALSTAPTDAATRQAALSSASNLVDAFHSAASTLDGVQKQADAEVAGIVAQVNQLSSQIAKLNTQMLSGGSTGSLADQRDALTQQLAGLLGVQATATEASPSLSTTNGSPLVIAGTAYSLQVVQAANGQQYVFDAQGKDITGDLTGGSLGGALAMRDQQIPKLRSSLDSLASGFASAMNAAQAQGFDEDGSPGQAMFTLAGNGTHAAAQIGLALNDPAAFALSSNGQAGSTGNLRNLLAVSTGPLSSGQSPTDTYASLVEAVGDGSGQTTRALTATTAVVNQLTNQQSSTSGVSIDEETANLLRYQQAYTAAAKVISVVNDLYSTLMTMGIS